MKTLLYTLALFLSLASCKSVGKLVEKGKYDEAFSHSLDYFKGSKKRKTNDVQAFERAYKALNERDLVEIERMQTSFRPENYSRIVGIYEKMMRRQSSVKSILPIISEDGYEAVFSMNDYTSSLKNASNGAADFHYNKGLDLLQESKRYGDKNKARYAYDEFNRADDFVYNFKNIATLKEEALRYGHKLIHFEVYNKIDGRAGIDMDRILWNYAVGKHDDMWHTFSFKEENDEDNADITILLEIHHLNISAEIENNHHFTESKEILVRTDKWVEKKDSILVEKEKQYFEIVTAKIVETFREKAATLEGGIRIIDHAKKTVITDKPIAVHFNFNDRGMVYFGDHRALNEETKKRLDINLDNFPMDSDIVEYLVSQYKNIIPNEIKRVKS
ncbi:MAG: hypothetical protein WAT79_13860 [Saprospiraceae bacterium]